MKRAQLLLVLGMVVFSMSGFSQDKKDSMQMGKTCGMQDMQMNMQHMHDMMQKMHGMKEGEGKQEMMQMQMGKMMDNMEMMMSMMQHMHAGKKGDSVACPKPSKSDAHDHDHSKDVH